MASEDTSNGGKRRVREYLRRIAEQRAALPPAERVEIPNPSKYAKPIARDAKGRPLDVPPVKKDR
jgi:hypothetical protein